MSPPVTPSPHRFRPPRDSRSSHKPPPSSLRREAPPPSLLTPGPVATHNNVSASQFKRTPRFSDPVHRPGQGADVTSTQSRNVAPASQHFAPKFNKTDSIEDLSPQDGGPEEQRDQDDEMLFDAELQVPVESVEPCPASVDIPHVQGSPYALPVQSDADLVDDNPSKRRRLSAHSKEKAHTSSVGAAVREHSTPRPPSLGDLRDRQNADAIPMSPPTTLSRSKNPPRTARTFIFKPSTPVSDRGYSVDPTLVDASIPPSTASTTTTNPSRPRNPFRIPTNLRQATAAADDDAAAMPLPEIFSPHRRNQKFVPGGMAETVRGWILEIGHSQTSTRKTRASRFVAGECVEVVGTNANRWRLLAGTAVNGEEGPGEDKDVRALLFGHGQGQGSGQRANIEHGDEVRLVAPSWDVEVTSGTEKEKQKWVIGVDWSRVIQR